MIDQVIVVIPARDEQKTLPGCVRSVQAAVEHLRFARAHIEVELLVVLDECTDDSELVLAACPGVHVLPVRARTAGGARAAGARHACATKRHPASRVWLANTDADSTVPGDWLIEMVRDAEHGAHVVLGTVEPDDELDPATRVRWQSHHNLVEGHSHVHGANFGIRADTYLRLGGWDALAAGEDVDLAARAALDDEIVIRRTARIPVTTSSRLTGRASDGFACYLRALSA